MKQVKIIATHGRSGYMRHEGQILPVIADGPSSEAAMSAYDAAWAIEQKLAEPADRAEKAKK